MAGSISSSTGNNSAVSAAMLKKMQEEMFKKNDLNGDGKISKDELTQVAAAAAKSTGGTTGQKGPTADEVMTTLDTNKDGSLSRLESDAGVAKVTQEMQAQGKGAPPSGGAPPPGGAPPSGGSSGSGSTKTYDKKDTNKDGTVSDLEELTYDMKHPEAAATAKTGSASTAKTGSSAETAAAKTYNSQTGTGVDTTVAGPELNVSA